MKRFILLAIPLALAGCAPVMPGDSMGDYARPPMVPYIPDFSSAPAAELPMLTDPEAETDTWTDYVWADDAAQAERKCQDLAEKATQEGGSKVTVTNVRRMSQRSTRYECTFEAETEGENDASL